MQENDRQTVRNLFRLGELDTAIFRRFALMSGEEKDRIAFLIELGIREIRGNQQKENKERQKNGNNN